MIGNWSGMNKALREGEMNAKLIRTSRLKVVFEVGKFKGLETVDE